MADGDGRGAECFACAHCHRTFAELSGLHIHIGMMHKRKVITSGVKRRRGDESKGGDGTRHSSEAVYDDGVSDGKSNDSVSGNDDCLEEHDAVHDRGHDEEHDAMLTEILSSLIVGDEKDGLQSESAQWIEALLVNTLMFSRVGMLLTRQQLTSLGTAQFHL